MSAFDNVIGYETIKSELMQICDMLGNREIYKTLGAKLPQGILLYGDPGLGKSLMAKSFISECGLPAYTIRRNKSGSDFVGEITETFKNAKKNAPTVVFLDDMDKFANEDNNHRNAEEYVAIQAGIDEIKGSEVFVLATANDIDNLPESLLRPGRFDKRIEVQYPTDSDAYKIITHYLSNKKIGGNVNLDDISMMMSYNSCAELETILNEAAINAAYKRKNCIEIDDLVAAVLRTQYDSPDDFVKVSSDNLKKTALHEAGHLVVCEILCPGSVGLASLRSAGRDSTNGFVHLCKKLPQQSYYALVALAGKAAVELYYSDDCASGCSSDIKHAYKLIRDGICNNATRGFGMLDMVVHWNAPTSDNMKFRSETVIQAELERHMLKVRDILLNNRVFLEAVTDALLHKETLLYSDIRELRESSVATAVTA